MPRIMFDDTNTPTQENPTQNEPPFAPQYQQPYQQQFNQQCPPQYQQQQFQQPYQQQQYQQPPFQQQFPPQQNDRSPPQFAPKKQMSKINSSMLWIYGSILSALGAFTMFVDCAKIQMWGVTAMGFSPLDILTNSNSAITVTFMSSPLKLAPLVSSISFLILFAVFMKKREQAFDDQKTVPAMSIVATIAAILSLYWIVCDSTTAVSMSAGFSFTPAIGTIALVICAIGIVAIDYFQYRDILFSAKKNTPTTPYFR